MPLQGLMKKREVCGPWVTVRSDVIGPLPQSKAGSQYEVVFEDSFTGYIEIRPLKKANAQNI